MALNSGRNLDKNRDCHCGLGGGLGDRLRRGLGSSFGGGLGGDIEGCLAAALGDGGGVGVAGSLKDNLGSDLERGLGSIRELKVFTGRRQNYNPRCRYMNTSNYW